MSTSFADPPDLRVLLWVANRYGRRNDVDSFLQWRDSLIDLDQVTYLELGREFHRGSKEGRGCEYCIFALGRACQNIPD